MNSRRTFVLGAGSALAANVVTRKVSASDKICIAVPGPTAGARTRSKGSGPERGRRARPGVLRRLQQAGEGGAG